MRVLDPNFLLIDSTPYSVAFRVVCFQEARRRELAAQREAQMRKDLKAKEKRLRKQKKGRGGRGYVEEYVFCLHYVCVRVYLLFNVSSSYVDIISSLVRRTGVEQKCMQKKVRKSVRNTPNNKVSILHRLCRENFHSWNALKLRVCVPRMYYPRQVLSVFLERWQDFVDEPRSRDTFWVF